MTPIKYVDGPPIVTETILLAEGGYSYTFSIDKTSINSLPVGIGGNSAFYGQHKVDGSVANFPKVNTMMRLAFRTSQRSTADINDGVTLYGAFYSDGENVGGFGTHWDVYHADTGTRGRTFGSNRELHKLTPGTTIGYHVFSMDGPGHLDNDYAYLASNSAGGKKGFNSVFSAGSLEVGRVSCNRMLDSRFADVKGSVVEMESGQSISFSPDPAVGVHRFDPATGYLGYWRADGTLIWGVNQSNGDVKVMWKP